MSAADQIRALADRLAENRGNYTRVPWAVPREGVCDACSQSTEFLVAEWKSAESDAYLCATCDRVAQDEDAAVNALPKVADLIEAIDDRLCRDAACPTCGCVVRARDALTAALGVSE